MPVGHEHALEATGGGTGKRAMNQLREILTAMDSNEATPLAGRSATALASAQSTKAVIRWGGALGLILIVGVGLFISRSLRRQVAAAVRHIQSSAAELQAAATQLATGSLEQETAMNEITTTISELLASSRQIAESSQRVAQIVEVTAATGR